MRANGGARRVLALAVAGLAAAGCGTTVSGPVGTTGAAGAMSNSSGLSLQPGQPATGAVGPAGIAAGVTGSALSSTAVGAVPPGRAGTSPQTHRGGATEATSVHGPVLTRTAVGVTATTIKIGVRYLTGAKQFSAAFGERGISVQDTKPMADAMIAYLNARGGIAGRRIAADYQPYNIAQIAEAQQQQQSTCAAWAEDDHVFAAVAPIPSGSTLPTCMAQHHTPLVQDSPGLYFDDKVMAQTAGYFYTPNQPNASRIGRFWVHGLARQGYFAGQPHIGLVLLDDPGFHRVADNAVTPAIAALGLKIQDEVAYGANNQDVASGVLRFKAEGITHVLILDDSSLLSQLWMNQAQSEDYFPRYGLNSVNAPLILEKNESAQQLRNSEGVGWFPDFDVDFSQDTTPTSATRHCRAIMRHAGVSLNDRASEGLAMNTCDTLWFLTAAVERSAAFTPADLQAAVAGLGDSYVPSGGFRARFGAGRADGASAARNFAFDAACPCFKYVGTVYPVP